jgi:hypothetical protein
MNSLFTAIYNLFQPTRITEAGDTRITEAGDILFTNKDDIYTDLSGRMYLKHAPQQATFPYCVYFSVSDEDELDFSEEREHFLIQFNIFSQNNSATEAGELLESAKTMFDNCSLTVTGWRHLQFKRGMVYSNDDFKQVPPIHGYSIEYDVILEKTRS